MIHEKARDGRVLLECAAACCKIVDVELCRGVRPSRRHANAKGWKPQHTSLQFAVE